MNKARESRLQPFHEASLVVFSAATLCGAGVAVAWPLAWIMQWSPAPPDSSAATLILILMGGGVLASLLHLGRPARAVLALRRVGRSPLSTEVGVAGLTILTFLSIRVLPLGDPLARKFWFVGGATAAVFLICLVRVYWLRGQSAWRGIPGLSPVLLSLLFGCTVLFPAAAQPAAAVVPILAILLFFDAAVWAIRCIRVERSSKTGTSAHPLIMARRGWLTLARFGLTILLFPAVLVSCGEIFGLAVLGAGILVDRFAFYALAVTHSSEAEVARVQDVLISISRARS